MSRIPTNIDWVGELVEDLETKRQPFVVDTDELDDDLIDVFVEELLRLTGDLKTGLDGADFQLIKEAAHSIKGMGGTIGLSEISALSLEIEHAALAEDLARSAELINGLVAWVALIE